MKNKIFAVLLCVILTLLCVSMCCCNSNSSDDNTPDDNNPVKPTPTPDDSKEDPTPTPTPDDPTEPLPVRGALDFVKGMDMSSVISLENAGVTFKDTNGKTTDVFKVLSNAGVTTIRVRVWNNPYDTNGNGYGGGNCDIDKAISIGKRATKYGMDLLVDFHYSDFWADPAKQEAPKAWANYSVEQKAQAVYDFTKDSLNKLKAQNIAVGIVQVGNETTTGMCGEKDWTNICRLMNQGSKAVRVVYPTAMVAVHFTNPEKANFLATRAQYLANNSVDYDIFGTSYYPCWHGSLTNLKSVLSSIATKYNKYVMVMETQYPYTSEDTDGTGNTISTKVDEVNEPYDYSVQGQYDFVKSVFDTVSSMEKDWVCATGKALG